MEHRRIRSEARVCSFHIGFVAVSENACEAAFAGSSVYPHEGPTGGPSNEQATNAKSQHHLQGNQEASPEPVKT